VPNHTVSAGPRRVLFPNYVTTSTMWGLRAGVQFHVNLFFLTFLTKSTQVIQDLRRHQSIPEVLSSVLGLISRFPPPALLPPFTKPTYHDNAGVYPELNPFSIHHGLASCDTSNLLSTVSSAAPSLPHPRSPSPKSLLFLSIRGRY